ncbi:MAG: cystathionine gamma-synthase family protein [Aquabacterium sp.]|uniref:cystathionine gamma-synthase family protein n=1 Tax=Aquabacterium sp. TaxID=1872578 RepID=UPI0025B82CD1|nr:cystathionine gamma-synthase family protein [Aquabacterium sp.]MBI5926731.1 cystathionine gamma-synthase family protein [Aquabacterium sp.]
MSQGLTTRLLHADRLAGVEHGAVHKPLHTAATYGYPTAQALIDVFQGAAPGYVYSRQGNPTGAALEAKLVMMEAARSAAVFSTGMAAISALFLSLLKAGDHVVSSRFLFGNTNSLLQTLQGLGVTVSLVDATEVAEVESACRPETRMVFVETIANPRTQVADLAGIGALCARLGLLYVVDNTMTTPVLLQGRDVQAGLVVHSLTKGIGGHGHALGGAVVDTGLFDWATYPHIAEPYRKGDPKGWGMTQIRKKGLRDMGATLRAEDAHRLAVGAETLALRLDRTCSNALQLAQWLSAQPQVAMVHYPGLPTHAQHERAAALFKGRFGSLMSIELREGLDPLAFLDALKLVILSSHLSDNRTLAIPVAHTIFWEMGPARRAEMGMAEGLIRLSIGIEDLADLQADFAQALARL